MLRLFLAIAVCSTCWTCQGLELPRDSTEEIRTPNSPARSLLSTQNTLEPTIKMRPDDASMQFGVSQPAYLTKSGDGTITVNRNLRVADTLQVGTAIINWGVVEQLVSTVAEQATVISELKSTIGDLRAQAGLPVIAPSVVNFTIAAGSTVSAGQFVSRNMDKVVGGQPVSVFAPVSVSDVAATHVTNTTFVVAYVDEVDGGKGKLWWGNVDTGAAVQERTTFNLGRTSSITVRTVGNKIVVAYVDESQQSKGKVWIGDQAGAKITERIFENTGPVGHISLTRLSDSKFVLAYQAASKGKFWIGTVTGAHNTAAETVFHASTTTDFSVTGLSETRFLVAYADGANQARGKIWIWDLGLGSYGGVAVPATVFNIGRTKSIVATAASSTRVAVAYVDQSDGQKGKLWLCSDAGQQVLPAVSFYSGPISTAIGMHTAGAESVVISFQGQLWLGKWATGTQTWTTKFSSLTEASSIVVMEPNRIVMAYSSVNTSKWGNLWIGDAASGAQAMGISPSAHKQLAEGSPVLGMALNGGLPGVSVQVVSSDVIVVPDAVPIQPMSFYYLKQDGMLTTSQLNSALTSAVNTPTLVGLGLPGNQLRTRLEPEWVRLAFSTNPSQCFSAIPVTTSAIQARMSDDASCADGTGAVLSTTPDWYRFTDGAQPPQAQPTQAYDGCYASGWLEGTAQPVYLNTESRQLCIKHFRIRGGILCQDAKVTNCGAFDVYQLQAPSTKTCPAGSTPYQSAGTAPLSCWYLGANAQSCDTVCASKGGKCVVDVSARTAAMVNAIASKLGRPCTSTTSNNVNTAPYRRESNGQCWYNSNYDSTSTQGSSCGAVISGGSGYSRFCPCSTMTGLRAPTCASGVLDSNMACWRRGNDGQSCTTVCAANAGTCIPNAQVTSGTTKSLMNEFTLGCDYRFSSSTSTKAPYWQRGSGSNGYCYFPSSSTQDTSCSTTASTNQQRICPCTN